ncbi:MAG: sulfurtransferase [bacterium]|nr:sulfurtransferase [bacterium]MDE0289030.1 sulfurtransferase [bacterium]MDE0437010.1 sulfurtransferase [bacterium]
MTGTSSSHPHDYVRPNLIIETGELEARLGDPKLRVIDCHIFLELRADGGYDFWSGREAWVGEHIPGSAYVDLSDELADDHPYLRFMLPPAGQFARVMSGLGVGNEHDVVVYSRGIGYWATRLFFMFRAFGFDNVRVLNGGYDKWAREGRPLTPETVKHPAATFVADPRAGFIVGLDEVVDALDDPGTSLVNALAPDVHQGKRLVPNYHRPGRIRGSVNVYAADLADPDDRTFKPADELRAHFQEAGVLGSERIVTYCGGGISATTDAFALLLLGHENVSVYDGSMTEWGRDPDLPMEVGP